MSYVRRSVLFEIHVAGQLVNELVGREFEQRGSAPLPHRGSVLFADNTGGRLYTVAG